MSVTAADTAGSVMSWRARQMSADRLTAADRQQTAADPARRRPANSANWKGPDLTPAGVGYYFPVVRGAAAAAGLDPGYVDTRRYWTRDGRRPGQSSCPTSLTRISCLSVIEIRFVKHSSCISNRMTGSPFPYPPKRKQIPPPILRTSFCISFAHPDDRILPKL